MGTPPRPKNRAWLIVGITLGVIALIGTLSYVGNLESDAASSGGGFPEAEYRLTVPQTLLGGEYKLIKDGSESANSDMQAEGFGDGPYYQNVPGTGW